MTRLTLTTVLLLTATPLFAQGKPAPITPEAIQSATFTGDLTKGQSALTAKVQLLLDRSGISPGVVDGKRGGMSESALKAFQRREGLPMDGILTQEVWDRLQAYAADPLVVDYTITQDDLNGLVVDMPRDYKLMAQMDRLGYTSVAEALGERFHMDEGFLRQLNPGIGFKPGETIKVMAPAKRLKGQVTRILVDKATRRVAAYDANNHLVADYPATVGSEQMPSPEGEHTVRAVALDPTYHYNPRINKQQGDNDHPLTLPPGPNGPVGTVWIDLSKPTYGIHGTPTPSQLFVNQSSGCVRLTNWDARELAKMVSVGTTVTFIAPGQTIADVMGTGNGAPGRVATGMAGMTAMAGTVPVALASTPVSPRPLRKPPHLATAAARAPATITPPTVAPATPPVASPVAPPVIAPAPGSIQVQTLPAPQVIPQLERALQQLEQGSAAPAPGM